MTRELYYIDHTCPLGAQWLVCVKHWQIWKNRIFASIARHAWFSYVQFDSHKFVWFEYFCKFDSHNCEIRLCLICEIWSLGLLHICLDILWLFFSCVSCFVCVCVISNCLSQRFLCTLSWSFVFTSDHQIFAIYLKSDRFDFIWLFVCLLDCLIKETGSTRR